MAQDERRGADESWSPTERDEHFFVMLGACGDAARLARFRLRLELDDGTVLEGVPDGSVTISEPDEPEIDHTGLNPCLILDGTWVDLHRVRRYCVTRPGT